MYGYTSLEHVVGLSELQPSEVLAGVEDPLLGSLKGLLSGDLSPSPLGPYHRAAQ